MEYKLLNIQFVLSFHFLWGSCIFLWRFYTKFVLNFELFKSSFYGNFFRAFKSKLLGIFKNPELLHNSHFPNNCPPAIYSNLHLYFFPFPQSKEKLHTISVSAGNGIIRKKYEEAKVKLCMKFKWIIKSCFKTQS